MQIVTREMHIRIQMQIIETTTTIQNQTAFLIKISSFPIYFQKNKTNKKKHNRYPNGLQPPRKDYWALCPSRHLRPGWDHHQAALFFRRG